MPSGIYARNNDKNGKHQIIERFESFWGDVQYEDTLWMDDAECRNTDSKLFFPERGRLDDVDQAKAICAVCNVRTECLDFALKYHERDGIWGGTSGRERTKIHSLRNKERNTNA